MMLIVWALASAYFVNTLTQNTNYNIAVRARNQLDVDRMAESIQVSNTAYSVGTSNTVTVSGQARNAGPSSVQFITVWVYAKNATWAGYNYSKLSNANVKGGGTYAINITLSVPGTRPNTDYEFRSWLVTARGNVIALHEYPVSTVIVSQVTEGIGSLMMDFQNFSYFRVSGNSLVGFPNGNNGYIINSGGSNIAFRLVLTNLDQKQRNITLASNSVFFSIFPTTPQQVRGSYWYIVNVNEATGTISTTYSNVTLQYNVATPVYFASDHAIVSGSPFAGAPSQFTGTSPINLALIGTLGGSPFGQNIPFVSIYVQS